MRFDRSEDWAAILSGLFGILLLAGFGLGLAAVIPVAFVVAMAAGILLLLSARGLTDVERRDRHIAGFAVVVAVLLAAIATVAATPLSFKGDPGTGVNQEPSAAIQALSEAALPFVLIVCTAAIGLAYRHGTTGPARAALAGGVGGALLMVLTSAATLPSSTAAALVVQALYALAFGALSFGVLAPWAREAPPTNTL